MWMVYSFLSKQTGQRYVGCTNNLNVRVMGHLWKATDPSSKFHRALKEQGIQEFELEVLATNIPSEEEAIEREKHYIAKYDSYENGYNSNRGGYGQPRGSVPWNKGKRGIHTEETLQKLSERRRGVPTVPRGTKRPKSAQNGIKGAVKLRERTIGRRKYSLPNGSWTWAYPKEDGTWYIRERETPNSKWKEVVVTPPLS